MLLEAVRRLLGRQWCSIELPAALPPRRPRKRSAVEDAVTADGTTELEALAELEEAPERRRVKRKVQVPPVPQRTSGRARTAQPVSYFDWASSEENDF